MKKNTPSLSIVTCTYNGERIIEEFLSHIFNQDYPRGDMEIILADGGSTDKTLEIIKNYQKKYPKIIALYHNEKRFPDGRGMGVDTYSKKAVGKYILLLDQDNILVQKNWITNMVKILNENSDVSGVQTRMAIPANSGANDKYLGAIGIEDPFAIPYSLNAQIVFNPQKFNYNKKGRFYSYIVNKNNFYYAGGNGFIMRSRDYFESGGYTQDIDNFYRMAVSRKKYKIAVPKDLKLYHKTSVGFKHMLSKRMFYVGHYLLDNYGDRDFYWFDLKRNNFKQNFKFVKNVLFNMLFVPGLLTGINLAITKRQAFWLIHPFAVSFMTYGYILKFFQARFFGKQKEAKI